MPARPQGPPALPGTPPFASQPGYLSDTDRKVAPLGFARGRASPGGRAESRPPAAPPRAAEKLLVGVSGLRPSGRASGRRGRGHSPWRPPAALPAFMVRAAGSPRASLGAPSRHRAGPGGPWSWARVPPAPRDPAARGQIGRPWLRRSWPGRSELTLLKVNPHFDLQILFLPPQAAAAETAPSAPLARQPPAGAPSWGRWVGGWVGLGKLCCTNQVHLFFFDEALSPPSLELLPTLLTPRSPHPFSSRRPTPPSK